MTIKKKTQLKPSILSVIDSSIKETLEILLDGNSGFTASNGKTIFIKI
jgi:hypothetical protein